MAEKSSQNFLPNLNIRSPAIMLPNIAPSVTSDC